VGNSSSIVFVLLALRGARWEDVSVRSLIASELVCRELPRWPLWVLQDRAEETLDGFPNIEGLPTDREEPFVYVPDVSEPPSSLPESVSIIESKLAAPDRMAT
jgi:hypothetical protein